MNILLEVDRGLKLESGNPGSNLVQPLPAQCAALHGLLTSPASHSPLQMLLVVFFAYCVSGTWLGPYY